MDCRVMIGRFQPLTKGHLYKIIKNKINRIGIVGFYYNNMEIVNNNNPLTLEERIELFENIKKKYRLSFIIDKIKINNPFDFLRYFIYLRKTCNKVTIYTSDLDRLLIYSIISLLLGLGVSFSNDTYIRSSFVREKIRKNEDVKKYVPYDENYIKIIKGRISKDKRKIPSYVLI